MSNKATLLQGLIFDEVVKKRQPQIMALRKGLERFGIMRLCRRYPKFMKELFVYSDRSFGAAEFLALIQPPTTTSEESKQAWDWFQHYVQSRESEPQGMLH